MAVARILILASIVAAFVAAQTFDCQGVTAPSSSMNYFVPPTDCRAHDANIAACFTQWGQCKANATDCAAVNNCVKSTVVCLDNIPAPAAMNSSSPCMAWNESFTNVKMYLDMGGVYNGSALQAACNYAACTFTAEAAKATINNGTACPIEAAVCNSAPKAPLRFLLTFAGNWAALLASKPDAIKGALQRGIAKLLEIAEYFIRILSFKSGSLIVEFAVLDPSADGNTVAAALGRAASDSNVLATAFSELAAESGITLELTSVAVAPGGATDFTLAPTTTPAPAGSTPAPGTGSTPTPGGSSTAGASAVSALVAVAMVAVSLLF